MSDSFDCDQFVGQSLDVDSLASNSQDLQTVVTVQMTVQCGDDRVVNRLVDRAGDDGDGRKRA